MAKYDNLRPGALIYSDSGGKGTLTCFVVRGGIARKIYGVTARHVLQSAKGCYVGDNSAGLPVLVGSSMFPMPGVDLIYFELLDDARTQLTVNNFIPIGYSQEPLQVWDPGKLRQKIAGAQTASIEQALTNKTMAVEHLGSTQQKVGTVKTPGLINKATDGTHAATSINSTNIAPGDSGGPVLDPTKLRYVGLVSNGGSPDASTKGEVVVLKDAFDKCGLVLATWKDKAAWD
jgi:hypothetical protein